MKIAGVLTRLAGVVIVGSFVAWLMLVLLALLVHLAASAVLYGWNLA